jgi:Tectonin domain
MFDKFSIRLRLPLAAAMMLVLAAGNPASAATSEEQFCWRNTKVRGAGTIPSDCEYSEEKQGLLCYPKCPAGSVGVGPVCWQSCPAGMVDNGVGCTKGAPYGRGTGYAWQGQDGFSNEGMLARCQSGEGGACEMWGAIAYPACKAGFTNVGANICSPVCPASFTDMGVSCLKPTTTRATITAKCPSGTVYEDGLCYKPCDAGYSGVGPVCWGQCPADKPIACGAGCAVDGSTKPGGGRDDVCATLTTEQVTSVTGLITDVIVTVATAGGYAGIKAGLKQGVKKGTKFISEKTTKEIAQKALEMMEKQAQKYIKDQTQAKIEEIIITSAQNALITKIDPQAETEAADFEWTDLDPTGIADIVNAYNHPTCAPPPPGTVVSGLPPVADIPIPPSTPRGIFKAVQGVASDIAVTHNGTAFAIGSGNSIWRFRPQDTEWKPMPGAAERISAGMSVIAVVNPQGQIYKSTNAGESWTLVPGWASDVAVDIAGNIFVLGKNGSIFEFKEGESVWRAIPDPSRNTTALPAGLKAIRIAASGNERLAVLVGSAVGATDAFPMIFDPRSPGDSWTPANSAAVFGPRRDLTITPSGQVWYTINTTAYSGNSAQLPVSSSELQAVAMGGPWMWAVDVNGKIFKAKVK